MYERYGSQWNVSSDSTIPKWRPTVAAARLLNRGTIQINAINFILEKKKKIIPELNFFSTHMKLSTNSIN